MKDAARLGAYLAGTVLLGALLAPLLFWCAQSLAAGGIVSSLTAFEFQTFFNRALLLAAILLLFPLLRSCGVRSLRDVGICATGNSKRDVVAGFVIAAVPLLLCGVMITLLGVYTLRPAVLWTRFGQVLVATAVVPVFEELFFRGVLLGILFRAWSAALTIVTTSAVYSIVHFLKPQEDSVSADAVTWLSGFHAAAHAFSTLSEPLLVLGGFATLFLIGCILADARLQTRSLFLPIGLHAGWIFANGAFNKVAVRELDVLPWFGKNLLVGIVPLTLALASWALMRGWLRHVGNRHR